MAVFVRRSPPPAAESDYRRYRTYVREDFCECCAYCLLPEVLAAGVENFELDHHKPQSDVRFASLKADYYNLYYSCHVCNQHKGAAWPSEELVAQGYRFVDPCRDVFSDHFYEDDRGLWIPRSRAGDYTAAQLRLNRGHLVEIRGYLREIAILRGIPPLDWDHPTRDQIAAFLR